MAAAISQIPQRAPTLGMSTDVLLRQAYAKEFARHNVERMQKQAYARSFAMGNPMSSPMAAANRPMARAGRTGLSAQATEVGAPEDALASFNLAIEQGRSLVDMLKSAYEAQKPGWDDYAKQAALTIIPRIAGM